MKNVNREEQEKAFDLEYVGSKEQPKKNFFYVCYIFERGLKGFQHGKRLYPVILNKLELDRYKYDFDNFLVSV